MPTDHASELGDGGGSENPGVAKPPGWEGSVSGVDTDKIETSWLAEPGDGIQAENVRQGHGPGSLPRLQDPVSGDARRVERVTLRALSPVRSDRDHPGPRHLQ